MEKLSNNEVKKTIESTAGAGFTDWKIRASEMGNKLLLNTLKNLDREPANDGRNAHHVILDKLKELNLPTEDCLFIELKDFLDDQVDYPPLHRSWLAADRQEEGSGLVGKRIG